MIYNKNKNLIKIQVQTKQTYKKVKIASIDITMLCI